VTGAAAEDICDIQPFRSGLSTIIMSLYPVVHFQFDDLVHFVAQRQIERKTFATFNFFRTTRS